MGIEPTPSAWKAEVLPLNYTRLTISKREIRSLPGILPEHRAPNRTNAGFKLVEGEGFEPSKAEPTDLQSAPFDRSGTPPKFESRILLLGRRVVNRRHEVFAKRFLVKSIIITNWRGLA